MSLEQLSNRLDDLAKFFPGHDKTAQLGDGDVVRLGNKGRCQGLDKVAHLEIVEMKEFGKLVRLLTLKNGNKLVH